jgi:hypothetical protein
MMKLEYKGLTLPDFSALPAASQEYLIVGSKAWPIAMRAP